MKNEKVNIIADFTINGAVHPTTLLHHQKMRDLEPNEINFTPNELIEMIGIPSLKYSNKNNIDTVNELRTSQSPRFPKSKKGI